MKKILGYFIFTFFVVGSLNSAMACDPYAEQCGPYNVEIIEKFDF